MLRARCGLEFDEPLIFERSSPGHCGIDLPVDDSGITDLEIHAALAEDARTSALVLPEVSEPEVCRHYTRLSRWNYAIDIGTYPLGSCTMKYNPKINEWAARQEGFAGLHPYLPESYLQGAFGIMWDLQNWLSEIGGFHETSLQPAAGAQGEFTGMLMILSALRARGEERKTILVPESAHGTNPATAALLGLTVVPVGCKSDGCIDPEDVRAKMGADVVGIMITNPNTLGIFEKHIIEISEIIHAGGGFVYGDGANLNALMGMARPGDYGIDVMHFNLHKTFTTPHGGGGPGCGAVGAAKSLAPFLPAPMVGKKENGTFFFDENRPQTIGRVRSFYGNFGMMVRAWTYMREMGNSGLKQASQFAVLNANYVKARLRDYYHLPYETDCLHEVIFSDRNQKTENGVSALDMAKRLIDYGFHPPTMYFPLVVSGALMIEPTETESKLELDAFCDAMIAIAQEAKENPELVKQAPHNTALGRLDEAKAARKPVLVWKPR